MTEYNGFGSATTTGQGSGAAGGLVWQNDSGAYTFGQTFTVDASGYSAVKARWYIPDGTTDAPTSGYMIGLWEAGNTTPLATAGPFTAVVGVWNEASFDTPVALTEAPAQYRVGVLFPGGYYSAQTPDAVPWDPAGPIDFPSTGRYHSGSSLAYPDDTSGTSPSYGVDVTVSDGASGGQTVNLGLAAETDAALALSINRTLTLGLAAETDAGLSLGHSKVLNLGLAAEMDAALSLSASKRAASATVYVVQSGSLVACTVYTSDLL